MSANDILVVFLPKKKTVKVPSGTNLIAAAEKAGITITNLCGNRGKCGKCKVRIPKTDLPYNALEKNMLSPEEQRLSIHLACQITLTDNLVVEIIDEDKLETTRFLTYDLSDEFEIDQHIQKIYIELIPPKINNQIDDLKNLENSIPFKDKKVLTPLPVLQNLPSFLRKNSFKSTFVVDGNEIVAIEAGDTTNRLFGVAVDLGTTTIVGSLVNMKTGEILGTSASTNPQIKYGADVISRVSYATSEPGGLIKLQTIVIEAINKIIEALCQQAQVEFREIYELSLAGNAIMNHLFLGVTPQFISEAPYIPVFRKSVKFMAEELDITIQPRGPITTLPNISGYVGGDITGFILASNIHQSDKIILGIDIGTNGEIVLGSKERLLCCSAAAGPAFEGGHISQGMRATEGAIDKFNISDGQMFYHVFGNVDPKGLCGTGLVDVIAELLRAGIINEYGKIELPSSPTFPESLKQRVLIREKENSFVLVSELESFNHTPIILHQRDVREVQLGKGAIAAGIQILCLELGITCAQIDEILIAGAFGSYLNKANAQQIGLIPKIALEKGKYVGNAASLGAKKFLLSKKLRTAAEQIIETTEYVELSSRADFQMIFAEKMLFEK